MSLFNLVSFGTPTDGYPVVIKLGGNPQLKQVNEAAFQPLLEYFEDKNYTFIGLTIDLTGTSKKQRIYTLIEKVQTTMINFE